MSCKVKNLIVRIITYLFSGIGMAAILIFQYFTSKNPMPTWAKVTVPMLIALLVAFLVYYKTIKEKINRKLIAIETAKEMGKAGETNSIVSSLLETIGVVIPLVLIATIFLVGGKYLAKTGLILFEMLAMYAIIIIGNIICDSNKKQELKEKELKQAEDLADSVAEKLSKFKRYE